MNGLAGFRVTAGARPALSYPEGAEATEFDLVILPKRFGHAFQYGFDGCLCLGAVHMARFHQFLDQVRTIHPDLHSWGSHHREIPFSICHSLKMWPKYSAS